MTGDGPKKRRRAKKGEPAELSASVRLSVTVAHRVWPPVPLDVAPGPPAAPDDIPAATLAALTAERAELSKALTQQRAAWDAQAEAGVIFALAPDDGAGWRVRAGVPGDEHLHAGRVAQVYASVDGATWTSTGRFVYYPPNPPTPEEAAALGERLRAGVEAAALAALEAALRAGDDGDDTAPSVRAAGAVRAYLDGELGPLPPLPPDVSDGYKLAEGLSDEAAAALVADLARDDEEDETGDERGTFSRVYADALTLDFAYRRIAELEAEKAEAEREAEEAATRLDRVELLPLPTALWSRLVRRGYSAAAAAEYEELARPLEYGEGLVIEAGATGQLRFAPAPPSDEVQATYPGIDPADARELADTLKSDGRLRGALIALAAVHFTIRHPWEWVEWDDRFRTTFGYKRPGGGAERARTREGERGDVLERSRREFDRLLYSRLRLGERAEAIGVLYSHDSEGRRTTTDNSGSVESKLYTVGRVRRDGRGLPVAIRFDPAGVSADLLAAPARSESLGYVQDVLSLPDTAPGRWAAAAIVFLATEWRTKVNTPECRPVKRADGGRGLAFRTMTRAYLYAAQPPDPPQTPLELLHSKKHAARATEYDAAAWELLREAGLIESCTAEPTRYAAKLGREPWPHVVGDVRYNAVRGVDWRREYTQQRLDPRPGGRLLAELLGQRERKQEGLKRGRLNRSNPQAAHDS